MIKRLIECVRGSSSANQEYGRWLEKEDVENPFVVKGFDCFHFVQSMISTTEDPNIAASFATLRKTDESKYHGKLPDNSVEVTCHLEYPFHGEVANGAVFKADSMEQKWDIYFYDNRLYFCRAGRAHLIMLPHSSSKMGLLIFPISGETEVGKRTT